MKPIVTSIVTGCLLAALASAEPQPRYTVIDLGTVPGGTYSFAFGINSAGEVAGAAATEKQTDGWAATAAVWRREKGKLDITKLGVLGPPLFPACPTCSSGAAGVSALGEVAMGSEIATLDPNGEDFGQWQPLTPTHRVTIGAVWRNGVMTPLRNLPGGNNNNVFWINNLGQISGVAENGKFDATCNTVTPFQVQRFQPVVWGPSGDIERKLPPLKADWVAYGFTINDHGEVVGASGPCSTVGLPPFAINFTTASHAVLWGKDGAMTDLGGLGGGRDIASSINNRGQVVGGGLLREGGPPHVWVWTRQTGIVDYGAFPGAAATVVGCCHTINDRGEIVGFSVEPDNPYGMRALIWEGKEPKDLMSFIRDPGPFVHLLGAFSINDAGEIVCQGITTSGEVHACLAVPNNGAKPATRQLETRAPLPESIRESVRRRVGIHAR